MHTWFTHYSSLYSNFSHFSITEQLYDCYYLTEFLKNHCSHNSLKIYKKMVVFFFRCDATTLHSKSKTESIKPWNTKSLDQESLRNLHLILSSFLLFKLCQRVHCNRLKVFHYKIYLVTDEAKSRSSKWIHINLTLILEKKRVEGIICIMYACNFIFSSPHLQHRLLYQAK